MRLLYLVILLVGAATAAAEDTYVSVGLGNVSCGEFVDYRRADSLEDSFARVWLGGYLTRFSRDARIEAFEIDMPSMMLKVKAGDAEITFAGKELKKQPEVVE